MVFRDRTDAGRRLAARLAQRSFPHPTVVALPRGGVPVGAEIAAALGAPLEVLVVRKVGHPANREFGLGAIAEGDVEIFDHSTLARLGIHIATLDGVVTEERQELARRVARYRPGRGPLDLHGRTAVVVDDGLATGSTAQAAIEAVRRAGAERVVLAVPVGSPEAIAALRGRPDEIVCLETPTAFRAVGVWYGSFPQVSDEEVMAILDASHSAAVGLDPAPDDGAHEAEVPGR